MKKVKTIKAWIIHRRGDVGFGKLERFPEDEFFTMLIFNYGDDAKSYIRKAKKEGLDSSFAVSKCEIKILTPLIS